MINDRLKLSIAGSQSAPDYANFKKPWNMKYQPYIFQGDTSFGTKFQSSPVFTIGTDMLSGSICYVDGSNVAHPGCTDADGNTQVPQLVLVGTETRTATSQIGNTAGGLLTTVPVTGYFRFVTQVFDMSEGVTYAAGDYLTVKEITVDGVTIYGISNVNEAGDKVAPYTDVICGIVDKASYSDADSRPSLQFTGYFLPAMPVAVEEDASAATVVE